MKISSRLPQFSKATALLIVTGQQGADFFLAQNGMITKIFSFNISKPRYSDHEGKFIHRGQGKIFSGGAVYEFDKIGFTNNFLRELDKNVRELVLRHKVTVSYLYAPAHLMNKIKENIMASLGDTYEMSFRGNYHGLKPFELLDMIMARQTRRFRRRQVTPTKREVVKILRRK